MKNAVIILIIVAISLVAGDALVDDQTTLSSNADWLQYHSGTPEWCCFQGTYRGVWFNTLDFAPGVGPFVAEQAEMWFYHDSSHPWDTGDVYIELYNGDAGGPSALLDQTMVTATHCTPVYVCYYPLIPVEQDFWVLANPEMSAGGCPSMASDGNTAEVAHSFYLDGADWMPWEYNFFISASVFQDPEDLDSMSWGSIKDIF